MLSNYKNIITMTLVIVTTDKSNQQILQLMEDIKNGIKGQINDYTEFICRNALFDTEYASFDEMHSEFKKTHAYGYTIS